MLLSVAADPQLQKITYAKSLEDFPYPEGGFYIHLEGKSTHYTALQPDQLKVLRAPRQNGTLSLRLAISLVCGGFLLDSFVHSSISATLL